MAENWNSGASIEYNINRLGAALDREVGTVVLTTGITYNTSSSDEIILVSGAIAPIFINLVASGLPNGKTFTVKDVGTATINTGGIVISGVTASIDGVASGMSMTSGYSLRTTSVAGKAYSSITFVYNNGDFWSVR